MDLDTYRALPQRYPFLSVIDSVEYAGVAYPVYEARKLRAPSDPTLCITAASHGLERIGTRIALSFLEEYFSSGKEHTVNLFCVPVLNPYGFVHEKRSNGNRVDLMRNAPTDGTGALFFGGHRLTPHLPYYAGAMLEKENVLWKAYVSRIEAAVSGALFCVDLHSGFGRETTLWPANGDRSDRSTTLFKLLEEWAQKTGLPYQEIPYAIRGDMLDWLYACSAKERSAFATLEIGTWKWLARRPWRTLHKNAWFNPPQRIEGQVVRSHVERLLELVRILEQSSLSARQGSNLRPSP